MQKILFSLFILLVGGCAGLTPTVTTSSPVKVGTKNFYGVMVSSRNMFGSNLKTLNTVTTDENNNTRVEHSIDAVSPGFFKALLPSGGVAGTSTKTLGAPGASP